MTSNRMAIAALFSLGLAGAACSQPADTPAATAEATPAAASMQAEPKTNIVEAAAASPDFSTLVSAVQAAGLAETLSGEGPFTVFAPTNAAFDKLPAGALESLTQPAQKAALAGILTYHVVPGALSAADVAAQAQAAGGTVQVTTVQGEPLTVQVSGSNVTITDAKGGTARVQQADLVQTNGVIHAIDAVLMPQ